MEPKLRGVTQGVEAWVEDVVIPTYSPMPADRNPMFLERRVYQGSSGKVYPLRFIDRISTEKEDRKYQAIHIENEYLYVMILPEIGGRIHIALDKTNGYDFFYRQNVIKPALVGLAGPWISGGVEINWPQHHRPSTFMPCEFWIEEHDDGSRTVWLGEHEPMNRMKGMHGVRISPRSSRIELHGHVYNRTPFVQTFLWWANVGVHVNEHYQSFFPPDVCYVADHAKRAMSGFPECTGHYYGVDYRPATGLDWYKNIPVPTSYMVVNSDYDSFGGYDHGKRAGFVHVADRHIAPGKKQWTWGNHAFGWAWDRNLTDEDGPYVELMAGVYTDNQPDFSFLMPYETRTFTQSWYPIQEIGPVLDSNEIGAISIRIQGGRLHVGVCVAEDVALGYVRVSAVGLEFQEEVQIVPGKPWMRTFDAPNDGRVRVSLSDPGRELVAAELSPVEAPSEVPEPATEPPLPADVETIEELYLNGLHLEQYRHATRAPEDYWVEALRRDPLDSRCNTAMASWRLRRGECALAEEHARAAIRRLTRRNPNPREGEAFYLLGLACEMQGKLDDATSAYGKATWNQAWAGAAHYRLACIGEDWSKQVHHLRQALKLSPAHSAASALYARLWRMAPGIAFMEASRAVLDDPLDHWLLREASLSAPEHEAADWRERYRSAMRDDPQNHLDLAMDYAQAGFLDDAVAVLDEIDTKEPMIAYARSFYSGAPATPPKTEPSVFPSRLEEITILRHAIESNPEDAMAPYLLGNLLYDRRRYDEAIQLWECSVHIDPSLSTAWRNLGIAYFNKRCDAERARDAYDRALKADPTDARVLYERDQLLKRLGVRAIERLRELASRIELVRKRDDLSLEICALYNEAGSPDKALDILTSRRFAPWEGGEGVALRVWTQTQIALGRHQYAEGNHEQALKHFIAAENPPDSLGEARHLLANASDVWFWVGEANAALNRDDEARAWWTRAADFKGDFVEMSARPVSEMSFYQALSLDRLGRRDEARDVLNRMLCHAQELRDTPAKIDFFATSLPAMLLFEDDLNQRNRALATQLEALAAAAGDEIGGLH